MAFAGLSSQLANRAREKHFERGVLPYAGALLQAGLRFTNDLSLAEDLVQQTMLRAWYDFNDLENRTNCRVWLFRIMLGLWNQGHRVTSNATCTEFPQKKCGEPTPSSLEPWGDEDVRKAIGQLRDDLRIVLLLFSVEEFSCAEISDILTIPVDTVFSNLAFARGLVKNDIGAQAVLRAAR